MPSAHRSLLLLFAILQFLSSSPLTKTLALTPPSSSRLTLTNPITTPINLTHSPLLNNVYNCVTKRWFAPCPVYYDCANAILKLPDYEDMGPFHNGPPNDPFRLPISKEDASCRVRVELAHEGRSTEAASWVFLKSKALTLANVCLITPLRAPENMGAWTAQGKWERLLIILEHSSVRDTLGEGNATMA